jgi:hypothetical protein
VSEALGSILLDFAGSCFMHHRHQDPGGAA